MLYSPLNDVMFRVTSQFNSFDIGQFDFASIAAFSKSCPFIPITFTSKLISGFVIVNP